MIGLCGASNDTKVRLQGLGLSVEMGITTPFRSSRWAERLKSWTPPWPRLGFKRFQSEAPETLLFNGGLEPITLQEHSMGPTALEQDAFMAVAKAGCVAFLASTGFQGFQESKNPRTRESIADTS